MNNYSHHVLLLDAKQKRLNAGPKARLDTAFFLSKLGFRIQEVPTSRSRYWQRILSWAISAFNLVPLHESDIVWCQFPVDRTTQAVLEKARRKRLKTVAFVHDIEGLKYAPIDLQRVDQEANELRAFTQVLGLNEVIGNILQSHGVKVTANLNMWDYAHNHHSSLPSMELNFRIVFAGSLAVEKSQFIYQLGALTPLTFDLYGQGLDVSRMQAGNVRYMGSFAPDTPPFIADGAIGLVWDGIDINKCSGDFGTYLAFNTPHKASMYLSCGIPVVVWKDAAIAPLIVNYHAGILISSLQELKIIMRELTPAEYERLATNAAQLGKKIRSGHFIHTAVAAMYS